MSHCTLVRIVHCSSFFGDLVAGAEEVDELGHVRDHVVDARGARFGVPWNVEDVDALEVELRGVDAESLSEWFVRDVLEAGRRLLPVLRLEVEAAARVLDLDELLLPVGVALVRVDVADVPVEGLDHRLLVVGHLLRREYLSSDVLLDVLCPTPGRLPLPFLSAPFCVLRQVDVLVAEHRRVRGVGRLRRPCGFSCDDRVERRAALRPALAGSRGGRPCRI